MEYRIVCAWCALVVQEGELSMTTHTMCVRCASLSDELLNLQVDYVRAKNAQKAREVATT